MAKVGLGLHHFPLFLRNRTLLTLLLIASHVSLISVPIQLARGQSPTWLKEGDYVLYEGGFRYGLRLLNGTVNESASNTTLRWESIDVGDRTAKLNLTIVLRQRYRTIKLSNIMNVDMEARNVSLLNGTSMGKTSLWLPANPTEGDSVYIGWQVHDTLQGAQRIFDAGGLYDLDTGILLQGTLSNEAILRALNISDATAFYAARIMETNIDLGPRDWWPEFIKALPFLLPIIAFASISLFMIRQRMKKHRRASRNPRIKHQKYR